MHIHSHTHNIVTVVSKHACTNTNVTPKHARTHTHLWWDSSITRDTNRFSDMFDFGRWLCIIKLSFRQVFTSPALHLLFVPLHTSTSCQLKASADKYAFVTASVWCVCTLTDSRTFLFVLADTVSMLCYVLGVCERGSTCKSDRLIQVTD